MRSKKGLTANISGDTTDISRCNKTLLKTICAAIRGDLLCTISFTLITVDGLW